MQVIPGPDIALPKGMLIFIQRRAVELTRGHWAVIGENGAWYPIENNARPAWWQASTKAANHAGFAIPPAVGGKLRQGLVTPGKPPKGLPPMTAVIRHD